MTLKRFKFKSPINRLESWLTQLIVLPSNGWQLRFPNHCINMYQMIDAGHVSFNTYKTFLRKILIDPFCQWKNWKLSQRKWLGKILCLIQDHSCSTLSALLAGVDTCPAGGGRSSLALGLHQVSAGSSHSSMSGPKNAVQSLSSNLSTSQLGASLMDDPWSLLIQGFGQSFFSSFFGLVFVLLHFLKGKVQRTAGCSYCFKWNSPRFKTGWALVLYFSAESTLPGVW